MGRERVVEGSLLFIAWQVGAVSVDYIIHNLENGFLTLSNNIN